MSDDSMGNMFDRMGGAVRTEESIHLSIEGASEETAKDIIVNGGISPTKRSHSKLTVLEGDNLLDAFKDAISDKGTVVDVNTQCLTATENCSIQKNL